MWTALIAWLEGSKVGRWLIGAAVTATAVVLLLWRVFAAGKASEKAAEDRASLSNLRDRVKTDDEITRMPSDDRRKSLSKWVRDDKG